MRRLPFFHAVLAAAPFLISCSSPTADQADRPDAPTAALNTCIVCDDPPGGGGPGGSPSAEVWSSVQAWEIAYSASGNPVGVQPIPACPKHPAVMPTPPFDSVQVLESAVHCVEIFSTARVTVGRAVLDGIGSRAKLQCWGFSQNGFPTTGRRVWGYWTSRNGVLDLLQAEGVEIEVVARRSSGVQGLQCEVFGVRQSRRTGEINIVVGDPFAPPSPPRLTMRWQGGTAMRCYQDGYPPPFSWHTVSVLMLDSQNRPFAYTGPITVGVDPSRATLRGVRRLGDGRLHIDLQVSRSGSIPLTVAANEMDAVLAGQLLASYGDPFGAVTISCQHPPGWGGTW